MKAFLIVAGSVAFVFFVPGAASHAAPPGGWFRGGGFQRRSVALNARPAFPIGRRFSREFASPQKRFFRRGHSFFVQQVFWPFYLNPYYAPDYYAWDASYLDRSSDGDYGFAGDSAVTVQPQDSQSAGALRPVVVVINQGSPKLPQNPANLYANSNSTSTDAEDRARPVTPASNEHAVAQTDPSKLLAATPAQAAQTAPQASVTGARKFILVSWLNDNGRDAVLVQNVETNEIQRVTSEVNRQNLRLLEVHPDADPREFEAIISNGSEEIPVKFRF